jgi:SAM-dependent methyltransferase
MDKYDKKLTVCKICGSDNIHKYHEDFNGNVIFICESCKVQFMNPQYSDEYLKEYYSKYTKEEPEWDEPLNYGHNFHLDLIEKYISHKGSFLDIGSGKGHLLKQAKKRGWECYGYDVDCSSVEYFSKKLGIKIFCGDFEKIKWIPDSFDVISMHHVFEHLKEPISYLNVINSVLVRGGILFIVIPNIKGVSSKLKFKLEKMGIRKTNIGKYYDTSHHLFFYEPKTLSNILLNNGYKILHIRSGHKVRPYQSMLKRYFLRNFSEKIPWKSTFMLIAKKQ